jgi:GTPase SAR1 family protein
MPQTTTPPASLSTFGPDALRIVLFGMPAAGKSSLLGALAQAAQTQEHVLNGHLTDKTNGLAELQRQVYEDRPRETLNEIVPYPVTFEPVEHGRVGGPGERLEAVLVDCDGRVANEVLAQQPTRDGDQADGALARALREADALVLVVDAAADPVQLESDFTQFARFLRLLELSRGQRTEVGGLPVFLVLAKCDLLAQPQDTPAAWIDRIEERKQEVGQHFRDFLAREEAHAPLTFGRIDLHLEAAAVKRPVLAGSPARPREPFGVAELFRQCLEDARAFRRRQSWSERRLFLTLAGSVGLIALMGLVAFGLVVSRKGSASSRLEIDVDRFRVAEANETPAARHRKVKEKVDELSALAGDPAFSQLPADKREFVESRLRQLKAYQDYEKKLSAIPDPMDARTEEQLRQIERSLVESPLPGEYRNAWVETDAARQRATWLDDIDALDRAIKSTRKGYQELIEAGNEVLRRKNEADLPRRARTVLDKAAYLPDPKNDKDKLIPGSRRVTYGRVFEMVGVKQVLSQWDEVRRELERFAK